MIHYTFVAISIAHVLHVQKALREQEDAFMGSIKHMPPEQQQAYIEARKKVQEKMAVEALEERRHQELCEAIRKSGFWG